MSDAFEAFIRDVQKAVVRSETASSTISHIIHHSDLSSSGVLIIDLDPIRPSVSVCCPTCSSDGLCAIWRLEIDNETIKSQVSSVHDKTVASYLNVVFHDPRPDI